MAEASDPWKSLDALGVCGEGRLIQRWLAPELVPGALAKKLEAVARRFPGEAAGAALTCAGRGAQALEFLERPSLWRVEAKLQASRVEEAFEDLRVLLKKKPVEPRARLLEAILLVYAGKTGGASAAFGRISGPLARALEALLILSPAGEHAKALARLDRAAAARPRAGWPLALRSQAHESAGRLDLSQADLDLAAGLEPEPWILRLRGRGYRARGVTSSAIDDLLKAAALCPGAAGVRGEAGTLLLKAKEYARAVEIFTEAASLSGDPSFLEQRAEALWFMGRPAEALSDLERCVELDTPRIEQLRMRGAQVALAAGRRDRALATLKFWSSRRRPGMAARAAFLRGLLDLDAGRPGRAAAHFDRAEAASRGRYFEGEFPAVRYGLIARALDYCDRRPSVAKTSKKKKPILNLTGLGLDSPKQVTVEVLEVLRRSDTIINNLSKDGTMEFLTLFCKDVRTISFVGTEVDRWVEETFAPLKEGKTTTFVTRGHPLVSGQLAFRLLRRAAAEGIETRCYSAVSSVDEALSLTQQVLGETTDGIQAYSSRLLEAEKVVLQPSVPALVYLDLPSDEGSRSEAPGIIGRLAAAVSRTYPPGHGCFLFGPDYTSKSLETVKASALKERLLSKDPRVLSSLILVLPPV